MKRKLLPRAILAALLLVLPAAANAPPDQYAAFDSEALSIKDVFTGLEWDRRTVALVPYGVDANCSIVASLNMLGRLPTVKELLTLLDEQPHPEYEFGMNVSKMFDQGAFDRQPVDKPYWTSTPAGPGKVWTVSFANGLMEPLATTGGATAYARCVR